VSATPSEEAMRLARPVFGHAYRCDPLRNPLSLDCESDTCEIAKRAFAIDALVASRVEEERERCAKVCDEAARNRWNQHEDEFMQKTTVFAQRSGSHPTTVRYAASLLAAAIRATPPPLPSKETR